jgi:5-methyltetrahydrofolate--homocysteine methyltransferase
MLNFQAITDALIACDEDKVLDLVKNGLSQGVSAKDLLNQGLVAGMDVVGERMEKETVSALVKAGIRDRVKVLVGGAPVSQAYADQIGADGYAPDAGSAAKLARSFL